MAKGLIISFNETQEPVRNRTKTVTRRVWGERRAKSFYPGYIAQAYTKGPHRGGEKICDIRIVSIRREKLSDITEEEVRKECFGENREDFIEKFMKMHKLKSPDELVWRVEFEYLQTP
jgi:hypothetical protein